MDKPLSKSEQALADAIVEVCAAGYVPEGHTQSDTVRVPTQRSPLYGVTGGELRTFGGRQKFHLPNSDRYVTAGKRVVCFYRMVRGEFGNECSEWRNVKTSDLDGIRRAIREVEPAAQYDYNAKAC